MAHGRHWLRAATVASAILVAGCGVTNPALKASYPLAPVVRLPGDETVSLVRLSEVVEASTDYSARYRVTARVLPGDYLLAWTGLDGGRYFQRRITLSYHGALSRTPGEQTLDGGVHIGADGAASLYWLWDDGDPNATQFPAPGFKPVVLVEVDEARRRARMEREALARQESAEQARRAAQRLDLAAAIAKSRVQCSGAASCDRAFAQGQAYVLKHSDMRIQVATSTLIETYNGTEGGKVSMRLVRQPLAGDGWEIQMTASCHASRPADQDGCERRLLEVYSGFQTHMQKVH